MVKVSKWVPCRFSSKRNPKTEILDQLPKNKISTAKVDSTFSYSSGGKFDSTKGIGRTSSNSYSKTISYNQQNYDTIASGKIITGMYTGQLLRMTWSMVEKWKIEMMNYYSIEIRELLLLKTLN